VCPLFGIALAATDGQRQVPGAVVLQVEQGVGRQLGGQLLVGLDPAPVEEEGGLGPVLAQELEQVGVHLAAVGAAAGVEGETDLA